MKDHGIIMEGPFIVEVIATIPTWSADDEGRLIYVSDVKKCYYGTNVEWEVFGNISDLSNLISRGSAYYLDGDNDNITLGTSSHMDLGYGNGTYFALVRNSANDGAHNVIFDTYDTLDRQRFSIDVSGNPYIQIGYSSTMTYASGSTDIGADGIIHSITAVIDRTSTDGLKLYVDGGEELYGNQEVPISPSASIAPSGTNYLGSHYDDSNNFAGSIFRFYYFNTALSEAEVERLSKGEPIPYKYIGATSTELVTYGDMETGVAVFDAEDTAVNCNYTQSASASIAGTYSGLVEQVSSGPSLQFKDTNNSTVTIGKAYSIIAAIKLPSGQSMDSIRCRSYDGTSYADTTTVTTTDAWTYITAECVDVGSGIEFHFDGLNGDNGDYFFIDRVSIRRAGCVTQLEQDSMTLANWFDKSGNEIHGTIVGATKINTQVGMEIVDSSGNVIFVVTDTGNVGVGETSPDEMLHLTSSESAKPVIKLENTNVDPESSGVEFHKTMTGAASASKVGTVKFIALDSGDVVTEYAGMIIESVDVANGQESGKITIRLADGGTVERDFIVLTGSNGQSTMVFGNSAADIDLLISTLGRTNSLFVQGSDGYVHIGGNSPNDPLEVLGNIRSQDGNILIRKSGTRGFYIYDTSGTAGWSMTQDVSDVLHFAFGGTTYTRMTSAGLVQIGAPSGSAKLNVTGTDTVAAVELKSTTGTGDHIVTGENENLRINPHGTGEIDFKGHYALQLQNIPDLLANGPSYWFDGTNDYITITTDDQVKEYGSLIHSVKMDSYDSTVRGLIGPNNKTVTGGVSITADTSNGLDFSYVQASGKELQVLTTDISAYVQYVLGMTWDSTAKEIEAFINGNSLGTDSSADAWTIEPLIDRIGQVNSIYFNGEASRTLLFNIVISDDEMKSMSSGAPVPYKYTGASEDELMPNQVDRDFSGASAWDNADLISYGETTDLSISASGLDQYCTCPVSAAPTTIGKLYRMTFTVNNLISTWSIQDFTGTQTIGSITTDGTKSFEWIAETTGGYRIVAGSGTSYGDFDDFTLKQLGCTLQLEQEGICHSQWIDISGNGSHSDVTGALCTNLKTNHIEKVVKNTITSDTTWTDIIPMGYMLQRMVFEETAGNAAILSLGTSDGAYDVFTEMDINASDITVVEINDVYALTSAQTLDINDDQAVDTWNSASINITFIMSKIT